MHITIQNPKSLGKLIPSISFLADIYRSKKIRKDDKAVAIAAPWAPMMETSAILNTIFVRAPNSVDVPRAFVFFYALKIGPTIPADALNTVDSNRKGTYSHAE